VRPDREDRRSIVVSTLESNHIALLLRILSGSTLRARPIGDVLPDGIDWMLSFGYSTRLREVLM
jgi:hypothetical protein